MNKIFATLELDNPITIGDQIATDMQFIVAPLSLYKIVSQNAANMSDLIADIATKIGFLDTGKLPLIPVDSASLDSLSMGDASNISEIVVAQLTAEAMIDSEKDLTSGKIAYDLIHEFEMGSNTIKAIEFTIRTWGDVREILASDDEAFKLYEFIRTCGAVVGAQIPITDSLIDKMSLIDGMTIRSGVLKSFLKPRKSWKKI